MFCFPLCVFNPALCFGAGFAAGARAAGFRAAGFLAAGLPDLREAVALEAVLRVVVVEAAGLPPLALPCAFAMGTTVCLGSISRCVVVVRTQKKRESSPTNAQIGRLPRWKILWASGL